MDGILYPQPQGMLDPKTLALLQSGFSLMSNSGPSRMPIPLGAALGQAGLAGLGGYTQATQQNRQNAQTEALINLERQKAAMTNMQVQQAQRKMEMLNRLPELLGGMQSQQPMQPAPVQVAQNGVSDNSATAMDAPWARAPTLPQQPAQTAQAAQGGYQLPPNLRMATALDLALNEGKNVPGMLAQDKPPEGMHINAQGRWEIDPQYIDLKKQIAAAGASKNITNVNAFTPASETAQAEFMKKMAGSYDTLKTAPTALANIEKAKALIPQAKGFMGPGGETMLEAAKFLNNRIGTNIDTQGIQSAEELRSRIFFNIMDNLKKMDAQPSQLQQQIMQESLGKLGTDPNALSRVLDAYGDTIRGKVQEHNIEASGAIKRGVKFPYDPIINLRSNQPSNPQPRVRKYNPLTGRIE